MDADSNRESRSPLASYTAMDSALNDIDVSIQDSKTLPPLPQRKSRIPYYCSTTNTGDRDTQSLEPIMNVNNSAKDPVIVEKTIHVPLLQSVSAPNMADDDANAKKRKRDELSSETVTPGTSSATLLANPISKQRVSFILQEKNSSTHVHVIHYNRRVFVEVFFVTDS